MNRTENDASVNEIESISEKIRSSINENFGTVVDPRRSGSVSHKLLDVFFIALCAILSGANDLPDITLYAKQKEEWLISFLNLKKGIPCETTFWWVFRLIKPKELQNAFVNWMKSMVGTVKGVIAIDGKALRGTADHDHKNSFVHMVSAWSSQCNLTLGQLKVNGKSNEITAIPELLDMLDIEGAVVTIGAIGCQTKISEKIIDLGGDYILAVKENQPNLYYEIATYFSQVEDENLESAECQLHISTNAEEKEKHGRIEERKVYSSDAIDFLPQKNDWKGLKSIICIRSKRTIKTKTSEEVRYYIASTPASAEQQGKEIRTHWGIENKVHWVLDVGFLEDKLKAKSGHIAENLAVMRHISLNLLKCDKTTKLSIVKKRFKSALNQDYLVHVLNGLFKITEMDEN